MPPSSSNAPSPPKTTRRREKSSVGARIQRMSSGEKDDRAVIMQMQLEQSR